ncbi:14681_t:CDS:1, partial [Acaulospora colombiana]
EGLSPLKVLGCQMCRRRNKFHVRLILGMLFVGIVISAAQFNDEIIGIRCPAGVTNIGEMPNKSVRWSPIPLGPK